MFLYNGFLYYLSKCIVMGIKFWNWRDELNHRNNSNIIIDAKTGKITNQEEIDNERQMQDIYRDLIEAIVRNNNNK